MPNCSIIGCGIKISRNRQNITLHRLPRSEFKRKKWLDAIGIQNLNTSTKHMNICSLHFNEACFNRTLDKTTLRDDAVPSQFLMPSTSSTIPNIKAAGELEANKHGLPSTSSSVPDILCQNKQNQTTSAAELEAQKHDLVVEDKEFYKITSDSDTYVLLEECAGPKDLPHPKICRICMNTERKMCPFDGYRINLYEQMTGTAFKRQDVLPKYVCWECGHYMSKYVAFRNKAIRSLRILTEILNKTGSITQTICAQHKLESNLSFTDVLVVSIEPDYVLEPSSSSSEVKVDNESTDNNINNFFNTDVELSEDLGQNNDEILMTETSVPSPINDITIETIDSDTDYRKSPENLSDSETDVRKSPENLSDSETDVRKSPENVSDSETDVRESPEYLSDFDIDDTRLPEKLCYVNEVKTDCETNNSNETKPISKIGRVRAKQKTVTKEKKVNKNNKKSPMDEIDREIFNVTELTIEEQIDEVQNRKESDSYKDSPFKCEKCFKSCVDSDVFERHMVKHTRGDFECPLCRTRFTKYNYLNQHMKDHMYKFTCKLCKFTGKIWSVVLKHQDHHKGKMFTCPHCGDIYTHMSSYMGHLRIKHPSNVICQYCGHSFVSELGLFFHKKVIHRFDQTDIPEDGPYCEVCDIRFANQTALETHKQLSHSYERTLKKQRQRKVDKIFRRKYPYQASQASQAVVDRPQPCEQCGENMPNRKAYFAHFRKEHRGKNRTIYHGKNPRTHMCEACGKLFASAAALSYHQYAHSSEKQFKCEYCGKLFQLEVYLQNHQKNHCRGRSEKTGYPCPKCGKLFSSNGNLRRHMVTHTGIKAFQCDFCDKKFALMECKKSHIEHKHQKKPWPKRNRGARKRPDQTEAV